MESLMKTYQSLNSLATTGGLVILGGNEDRMIPLCELKETFDLQYRFYNRSIPGLCLDNAATIYEQCVAPLAPQEIYLHIGDADKALFEDHAAQFDLKYSQLVQLIRSTDKKCAIAIISLKNPDNSPLISEMNKHLAVIAQNEHCEFCDLTQIRVWSPHQTKEVMSFIYSLGFVHPLKQKPPLYDIAKLLFCYEHAHMV